MRTRKLALVLAVSCLTLLTVGAPAGRPQPGQPPKDPDKRNEQPPLINDKSVPPAPGAPEPQPPAVVPRVSAVEELMAELEAVQKQKADLEKRERDLKEKLQGRLKELEDRLKKMGVVPAPAPAVSIFPAKEDDVSLPPAKR